MHKSALKNATTGLAGAVALAGGSQAYGSVVSVTVPANLAATATNTPVTDYWDVNGDGTPDFQLTNGVSAGSGFATSYSGVSGAYQAFNAFGFTNQVIGTAGTYANYATRLANGTTIGPGSTFIYGDYLTVLASRFNGKNYGNFRTQGNLGFEFEAADGLHYGYLNLKVAVAGTGSTSDTNYTATTTFYTAYYETTPNTPITIGGAVPEPTSLAALAFGLAGATGAAAYRRKKASQPAA